MTIENKHGAAQLTNGNRTTGVPVDFKTHHAGVGHSVVIGPTKDGMTVALVNALRLSDAEVAAIRPTDAAS